MTTGGEGGMLTTNDPEIWESAWSYKDHGKSYDACFHKDHAPGFRWLHEGFGTNWRMTEMQASIGRIQLRKLPAWIEARRQNARVLIERLSEIIGLYVPVPSRQFGNSYYRLYALLLPGTLKEDWDRNRIMVECNKCGVSCTTGSCSEIYLEKAFQDMRLGPAIRLPVARDLGERSLVFQVHPTLTEQHMHRVADVLEAVMRDAVRS
jgi:dTDP-4-amino-4,6-dideoxygalactose transaminase